MTKNKKFLADLPQLHSMLRFVKDYCINRGCSAEEADKIMLAVEEALVNIIKHGYKNRQADTIEIICEDYPDRPGIKIMIRDKGIPYNPLAHLEDIKKRHLAKLENLENSGYGVYIYVNIMDKVEYQRKDDANHLSLIKYFN